MVEDVPLDLTEIKKRIRSAFFSLIFRQVALRAMGFISINIILIRLLPLETIGIFNIANAIITFFAFFADVGLGASLIQKKEKIEYTDIKTTFTIQQIMSIVISLVIIIGAPFYGKFYGLSSDGIWLIRALGISFLIVSLKVIPSVLLERQLQFKPLVIAEILENLSFNILLIVLVVANFGIWSFSVAAVARSIVGVVTIYILAPVKLGIGIDKISARTLLSFGVPFQLNNFLALIKDRLVPLVVAGIVGPIGMSYITWSQAMAFLPLEVMNTIIRLTFPAFSRLQDNSELLGKAIEKSLFITSFSVYPFLFGLCAILPFVVSYIVTSKVEPAIPSFYLFAFSTYWAVISTISTNALNAIGKINVTLKLMIFWTILTWVLTPLLVINFGFIGVSLSAFIISFTSIITIILLKRNVKLGVIGSIALPTISSLIMSMLVYLFCFYFVKGVLTLSLAVILGILIYALLMFIFGRERILADIKALRND